MVAIEKIDIERLKKPSSKFRIMEPTEEKIDAFVEKLMTGHLYISDEARYPEYLKALVGSLYSKNSFNLVYEIGDFSGVLIFRDVVFDHKADVVLKLWDGSVWGPSLVGEGKGLLKYVIETFGLKRLGTATADERIVRMAQMVGFSEEGTRLKAFAWKGKLYDETLLSIVRA